MITINIRKANTSEQVNDITLAGDICYTGVAPRYIPNSVVIAAVRRKNSLGDEGWHFGHPYNGIALLYKTLRTPSGRMSNRVDQSPLQVTVKGYTHTDQSCGSKGYLAWLSNSEVSND